MRIKCLVFLAIFSLFSFADAKTSFTEVRRSGVVGWVIDGDTFKLSTGEKIRLIGVDTPEYQPWRHHVERYGKEASAYSKKLLINRKVLLVGDVKPADKFGRTLAYVYLENGMFVNLHLVEEGYAQAMRYPPNTRYSKLFQEAQKKAKSQKKGLWKKG